MNRNCFGRGDKEYVTVGECGGLGIETAKLTTADTRQELSMVFNFDHLDNAGHMRFDEYQYDLRKAVKTILKWQVEYTNHCWPTLLFENHDNPRVTSKVDPTDTYTSEIAKLCAVLEMTLKGSPFIYQGQELGMTNTHFDSMDGVRDVESINFIISWWPRAKSRRKRCGSLTAALGTTAEPQCSGRQSRAPGLPTAPLGSESTRMPCA